MSQNSYTTTVTVTKPEKIGDGIKAYVRYTVITQTNNPKLGGQRFENFRRFREFHALYEYLVDTYRQKGYHIPHPPEKSVKASTQVKVLSKDATEIMQIEQRRIALERFINKVCLHSVLSEDERVIDFLKNIACVLKGRDKFLKLSQNVTSTFAKLKPEFDEYDQWFEEKVNRLELLESNLRSVNSAGNQQYSYRSEYVTALKRFSSAVSDLCSTESNGTIVKALTQISLTKDKTVGVYEKLMLSDIHEIIGTSKDFLDDIISLKHLFNEYIKRCSLLKSLDGRIQSKKDAISKAEIVERPEKIASLKFELEEVERLKTYTAQELDDFTAVFKSEVNKFEEFRVKFMRDSFIRYVRSLKEMHEEMISLWESTLPFCQSIN